MLKIARSTSVILLFCCPLIAQRVYVSDRKIDGPFGPVRSVRNEAYNCSGDPAEKPWRVSEVTYDRQGNETWRAFYEADGSPGHQVSNTWDAEGRMTGWSEYYGNKVFPPAGLHKHADFAYSAGKLFRVLVYRENELEYKITYTYDDHGNKTGEVTVNKGGGTSSQSVKYDSSDRVIERSYFDASTRSPRTTYEYDSAANVLRESSYEYGKPVYSIVRVFEDGKLAKETTLGPDGSVKSTKSNTYNLAGSLISSTIDNESVKSKTTIEYYDSAKIRSKDSVTVAKENGKPMGSEDEPIPGRIVEKYNPKGEQVERLVYDAAGKEYLKQMSSYNQTGQQIGLIEKSASGQYDRNLVYEYDSYRNRVKTSCVQTTPTGELHYSLAERNIITFY